MNDLVTSEGFSYNDTPFCATTPVDSYTRSDTLFSVHHQSIVSCHKTCTNLSMFLTSITTLSHTRTLKLQALVYNILPSTTAIFSYATGSRKLLANEQFFVGAQTVVSLLQTAQIISDVCFITDHVAYTSSNKTKIF